MSSGASAIPDLMFRIASATVSELTPLPSEVATSECGAGTDSFGPTQITLHNTRVTGVLLQPGMPYNIKAARPHRLNAQNMHFVGKLENGQLLFRAPLPNA